MPIRPHERTHPFRKQPKIVRKSCPARGLFILIPPQCWALTSAEVGQDLLEEAAYGSWATIKPFGYAVTLAVNLRLIETGATGPDVTQWV